jgi:hypothetical protein
MLTKGFIEQQIEIMADAIGDLVNKQRLVHEMTDPYRNEGANELEKKLLDLLAEGKVNEAENLLFAAVKNDKNVDHDYLRVALDFYLKVEELIDDELADANFSRAEVLDGWSEITVLLT